MNDDYDELFVDKKEPRKRIVKVLKPFLRFTNDGEIIYQEEFDSLSLKKKILLILLASKVLKGKDFKENEKMAVKELAEKLGAERSSIEGFIYGPLKKYLKTESGKVKIPSHSLNYVLKEVEEES